MAIQLYGQFGGFGSFDIVSREIAWAMKRRRVACTIYGVGSMSPRYVQMPQLPISFNMGANVGIYVGYPDSATGWLRGHAHSVLVTVCEADPVPSEWVEFCNKTSMVVVPSQWCADVLAKCGVRVPIKVVPHGIPDSWVGDVSDEPRKLRRLLHVTGALSFPHRKGTSALILAFSRVAKDYPDLELHIKSPATGLDSIIDVLGSKIAHVGSTPVDMRMFYKQYDAIVQPSRGEGFGLVPLEARCLGIPVVVTADTGHGQHFVPGADTQVATGTFTSCLTQGNSVGCCPTVNARDIEVALRDLIENYDARRLATGAWAKKYARVNTWSHRLRPLIHDVASIECETRVALTPGEEAGVRGL